MRILECEGLNKSDEKTKGFSKRVEMEFLKLRGDKSEILQSLGSHGRPNFWPPIPSLFSATRNSRKWVKGPRGLV